MEKYYNPAWRWKVVQYRGLSVFHPGCKVARMETGDIKYACHSRNFTKQTCLFKLCTIQPCQWSTCADYHYFVIHRKYAQRSVCLTFSGLESENHCLTVLADVTKLITAQLIANLLRREASPFSFFFWLLMLDLLGGIFLCRQHDWWRFANHPTGWSHSLGLSSRGQTSKWEKTKLSNIQWKQTLQNV